MQSLLDTLLLLSVTVCTLATALIAGCSKKKPGVMTDMPNTGDAKTGTQSASVPPAPPPTAVSGDQKAPAAGDKTPSVAKPIASPSTNPIDQSDKKVSEAKKVPPGAVEDDGGYENCKDMTQDELKKALVP